MKYFTYLVLFAFLVACFDGKKDSENKELTLHLSKGWDYFLDTDYSKSKSSFEAALEEDGKSEEALCGKAWSNLRLNEFQIAQEEFEGGLEANSESVCFAAGLAYSNLALENYSDALANFANLKAMLSEEKISLGPDFDLDSSDLNKSYAWSLFMENDSEGLKDLYKDVYPDESANSKGSIELLEEILKL